MTTVFLAALLAAILTYLFRPVQDRVRRVPIWIVPIALTAVFTLASVLAGAFSITLTAAVLAYTCVPVACIRIGPKGFATDFLAVLLLWLPIEFAAGASLVPRPAQGFLHSVIYGVAILLGLAIFLGFRDLPGMKYNPPRAVRDVWLPLVAFVITAPVLVAVGIPIGFIPPPHLPTATAGKMAAAVGLIFAGTALPEEILFRSLIQNIIMQRFGNGNGPLLAASVIFGCAHLDNGPQPLPNWRYAILAAIAGFAYGKIFYKSKTIISSAILHTLVDWTKHFFF